VEFPCRRFGSIRRCGPASGPVDEPPSHRAGGVAAARAVARSMPAVPSPGRGVVIGGGPIRRAETAPLGRAGRRSLVRPAPPWSLGRPERTAIVAARAASTKPYPSVSWAARPAVPAEHPQRVQGRLCGTEAPVVEADPGTGRVVGVHAVGSQAVGIVEVPAARAPRPRSQLPANLIYADSQNGA
jgi:hypothetical protein